MGLVDFCRRSFVGSARVCQDLTVAALMAFLGTTSGGSNDEIIVPALIHGLKDGSALAVNVGLPSLTMLNLAVKTGIRPEHALAAGESIDLDAGPAIRRILADGRPLILSQNTVYVVGPDTSLPINDGGITSYRASISVPSGATIIGEPGHVIRQADGAQIWRRIVEFHNVSNFRVIGSLNVDGNLTKKGILHNEHMHGVAFFNATNFDVDAIESCNTRGDNVYVGGTDNSRGTSDGRIGRITARKAGRKNLTLQVFDNLSFGSIDLDNTEGGIAAYAVAPIIGQIVQKVAGVYASDTGFPMLNTTGFAVTLTGTTQASLQDQGFIVDTTDGHSLDIEPDVFSGTVPNRAKFESVRVRGTGADFTAGTTATASDGMRVSIGTFDIDLVQRPGTIPWIQYAITLNIDTLRLSGLVAASPTSTIYYAARLNVGELWLDGTMHTVETAALLTAAVGGHLPKIQIGTIAGELNGAVIEARDTYLEIDKWRISHKGTGLWARGISTTPGIQTRVRIGLLELNNCGNPLGYGYAMRIDKLGSNEVLVDIGLAKLRDNRVTPLVSFISVDSGAENGLSISGVENDSPAPTVGWSGITDTLVD